MAKEEFEKFYSSKNYNQPYRITSIHMTSHTEIRVEFLLSQSADFEICTEGTVDFTYDYGTETWSVSHLSEIPPTAG